MLVVVPRLDAGEKAEALVTFEVTRRAIDLPTDPSAFRLPEKVPRDTRKYLAPSPLIDCRNRKIRDLAKEITTDKEGAWQQVEAIHDWVKENVQHTNDKVKGSVETLHDKRGHLEDLDRVVHRPLSRQKIPARTVWVPDYCYAEFYLEDSEGKGILVSLRAERENGVRYRLQRLYDSAEGRQLRSARKEGTAAIRQGIREGERTGVHKCRLCGRSCPSSSRRNGSHSAVKRLAFVLSLVAALVPNRGWFDGRRDGQTRPFA